MPRLRHVQRCAREPWLSHGRCVISWPGSRPIIWRPFGILVSCLPIPCSPTQKYCAGQITDLTRFSCKLCHCKQLHSLAVRFVTVSGGCRGLACTSHAMARSVADQVQKLRFVELESPSIRCHVCRWLDNAHRADSCGACSSIQSISVAQFKAQFMIM